MTSPFDNTDKAFCVFYNEHVVITHGGERQTIHANVFTDGMAEPLTEDALDTDMEEVLFVFRRKDWAYVSKLVRGDTVEREDGAKYRVSSARRDAVMGWVIHARSV